LPTGDFGKARSQIDGGACALAELAKNDQHDIACSGAEFDAAWQMVSDRGPTLNAESQSDARARKTPIRREPAAAPPAVLSGYIQRTDRVLSQKPQRGTQTMAEFEYKGYRIEVSRVGRGWRASIFSPGSTSPWRDSPTNLESSRTEEIVAEAKRIIDARLGPRLL
jgi:hypothetical protein